MQFLGQLSEKGRQGLQLLRLLRDDTGERTLVRDQFILGTVARPVRDEPDGLGCRDAHFINYPVHFEFPFGCFSAHPGCKELGQGFPVLVIIGEGGAAFSGLEIIFQVDFLVSKHMPLLTSR